MYVVLAQGCMFPHELIHQLASASELYAEKCASENTPGLPSLRFAYKKDTMRLQKQGIERGAAVIAFSYSKRDFEELMESMQAELKSLVRIVSDTSGQLVSIEVRMPEVKPWVPLRVMELRAEVKVCIYSPELAENEELFAMRAAQLLYKDAGLQGSFVAHRLLKWGGGMGTVMVRVECEAAVRMGLRSLYEQVKKVGVLGRTIEGERYRVMFAPSLDAMVKNATALGLLKADSAGSAGQAAALQASLAAMEIAAVERGAAQEAQMGRVQKEMSKVAAANGELQKANADLTSSVDKMAADAARREEGTQQALQEILKEQRRAEARSREQLECVGRAMGMAAAQLGVKKVSEDTRRQIMDALVPPSLVAERAAEAEADRIAEEEHRLAEEARVAAEAEAADVAADVAAAESEAAADAEPSADESSPCRLSSDSVP